MQRWRPDTCGCVVLEEVQPDGSKVCVEIEVQCPAHASVPPAQLYAVIYASPTGENRRKNLAEAHLLADPDLAEDRVEADQLTRRVFKPGVGMRWRFEGEGADRELVVIVDGAADDRAAHRALAALPGRARVEVGLRRVP